MEAEHVNLWLMEAGGAISILWGAAHIFPTRSVVAGFGVLSTDNRRILIMEWVAEGLTLIFIGVLVLLVCRNAGMEASARLVVRAIAVMLTAMAALTAATGARTGVLPMRLCPFVKLTAAGLLIAGSWS
jgi:hypothetical protein